MTQAPIRPEPFDANDGTLARDDQGRYVIAWVRHLKHSPERVWRAITDQNEIGQWARGSWDFEPRVGGNIALCLDNSLPPKERVYDPGLVTAYDPPKLLEFKVSAYAADTAQDGEHILRWSVQPDGDGCVLGFTDIFEPGRRIRNSIVCGWQFMLDQLSAHLSPAGSDWGKSDTEMERIYWRYRNLEKPADWP